MARAKVAHCTPEAGESLPIERSRDDRPVQVNAEVLGSALVRLDTIANALLATRREIVDAIAQYERAPRRTAA